MTPDKERKLFGRLADIGKTLEHHGKLLEKIITIQEKHAEQIAEVKGQVSMLALWLQSTDQRFTAIMAPYHQKQAS